MGDVYFILWVELQDNSSIDRSGVEQCKWNEKGNRYTVKYFDWLLTAMFAHKESVGDSY